jgi:hypothetical protein
MAHGFVSLPDHEHSDRSAPGTRRHRWCCIMAWDGLAWPGSLSFLTGGGARYQTFGRLRNPRRRGLEKTISRVQAPVSKLPCPSAQKACPARSRLRRHSLTTLEVGRDYCAEQIKGTRGTLHEFRRAWCLVSYYLRAAPFGAKRSDDVHQRLHVPDVGASRPHRTCNDARREYRREQSVARPRQDR